MEVPVLSIPYTLVILSKVHTLVKFSLLSQGPRSPSNGLTFVSL